MIHNLSQVTTANPAIVTAKTLTSQGLLIAAFALILITGVIGNAIVIYVFGYKLKYRSTTELLTLYLGITDLLSSFFNPSLFIYWTLTDHKQWGFGKLACYIFPTLGPIMTSISSGLLLIFAIDRYIAFVTPFRKKLSQKTVNIAFTIDIFLSIFVYFHYILALKFDETSNLCIIPYPNDYSYGIPNCIFIILRLSFFATVFCFTNVKIYQATKKSRIHFSRIEDQIRRRKQTKKIMVILLTMGIVFTLLVFPRELFFLGYNLVCLLTNKSKYLNPILTQINSWLKVAHTANSCANVFIYSQMQTLYRKQIVRIFSYIVAFKKTFHLRFSSFQMSYSSKISQVSSCVIEQEFSKVLILSDEDTNEAVFFQRAQQWKTGIQT
ncbi:somatostatin receptor type 2-like [Hydra vulgaris]|uniref:Somatostatin receptor type 2-like n=1 Tax=Hydra vulgaris TaxID=6087 RepID=A0ABM4B4Q7_HYDVU